MNKLNSVERKAGDFLTSVGTEGYIKLGSIAFCVLNIVLAILILRVSSQNFVKIKENCDTKYKKNVPGMMFGIIILVGSFIILCLFFFGDVNLNEFRRVFIMIISAIFFMIIIFVLVSALRKDDVEEGFSSLPTGICELDNEMGIFVNGQCRTKRSRKNKNKNRADDEEDCETELKKCKDNNKKATTQLEKKDCDCDESFVSRGDKDGNFVANVGLCEYKDSNNVAKFGYSHPAFGKKCVSGRMMADLLKNKPKYGEKMRVGNNVGFIFNPYQSTQCYGFPRSDLVNYDIKCKNRFGEDYGVKSVENFGCPQNDFRGICEVDYQMGVRLDENSTKCVPIGTDMNTICNLKHQREKKSKYEKTGYKTIQFSGCPQGYQRAICDGNYYDGKELFTDTTECFNQSISPDRMCKIKYGPLSFAARVISENCVPGNIRAICTNTDSQKPGTGKPKN